MTNSYSILANGEQSKQNGKQQINDTKMEKLGRGARRKAGTNPLSLT